MVSRTQSKAFIEPFSICHETLYYLYYLRRCFFGYYAMKNWGSRKMAGNRKNVSGCLFFGETIVKRGKNVCLTFANIFYPQAAIVM